MKKALFFVALAAQLLATGCGTTAPDPTDMPAWNQIQIGMTRDQVYAIAGKPLGENQSESYWESPSVREGWPSSMTFVRKLTVTFDASGEVLAERSARMQK